MNKSYRAWVGAGTCLLMLLAAPVDRSEPVLDEPVRVNRRIEPRYPLKAYHEGISSGYAAVAFYVDDIGRASDFLAVEYSRKMFADELMKVLPKWDLEPAKLGGGSVKSVCRAYWKFYPDRPVVTDVISHVGRKMDGRNRESYRELKLCSEKDLDEPIRMRIIPPIVAADASKLKGQDVDTVLFRSRFYVDTTGQVRLPEILESTEPSLESAMLDSLRNAWFDIPLHRKKRAVVYLDKTYRVPVTYDEDS